MTGNTDTEGRGRNGDSGGFPRSQENDGVVVLIRGIDLEVEFGFDVESGLFEEAAGSTRHS